MRRGTHARAHPEAASAEAARLWPIKTEARLHQSPRCDCYLDLAGDQDDAYPGPVELVDRLARLRPDLVLQGEGAENLVASDDVEDGCQELERCAKLGLAGVFIPVSPLADRPYRHPIYERFWWTAQDVGLPLLLHIGTPRGGVPGCEFTMNLNELTGAGRSTTDYWVRYSLSAMIFAGVFDRCPKLKVGSVEHEAAWIPHWLKQMDFTYRERPVFTKGWRSKEGLLPSDYWRRNMFVEFMEDDLGIKLRDEIGVDNMLWGSDFPHAESTWPRSQEFLRRIFAGTPKEVVRQITAENAARMFGFEVK